MMSVHEQIAARCRYCAQGHSPTRFGDDWWHVGVNTDPDGPPNERCTANWLWEALYQEDDQEDDER